MMKNFLSSLKGTNDYIKYRYNVFNNQNECYETYGLKPILYALNVEKKKWKAINMAFSWRKTKQGFNYWAKLASKMQKKDKTNISANIFAPF